MKVYIYVCVYHPTRSRTRTLTLTAVAAAVVVNYPRTLGSDQWCLDAVACEGSRLLIG